MQDRVPKPLAETAPLPNQLCRQMVRRGPAQPTLMSNLPCRKCEMVSEPPMTRPKIGSPTCTKEREPLGIKSRLPTCESIVT